GTGASTRELRPRPPAAGDDGLAPFAEPEAGPPTALVELRPSRVTRMLTHDGGAVVHTIRSEEHTRLDEIELEIEHESLRRYTICDDDPLSAAASVEQGRGLGAGAGP